MIRLRLDGTDGQPPIFVCGITDRNVARLTDGNPMKIDLSEMGGSDVVAIFHGADADALREQLGTVLSEDELASLTSALDQLGAMEAEVSAAEAPQ